MTNPIDAMEKAMVLAVLQYLHDNITNEMAATGALHLMEKEPMDGLCTPSFFHRAMQAALKAAMEQHQAGP